MLLLSLRYSIESRSRDMREIVQKVIILPPAFLYPAKLKGEGKDIGHQEQNIKVVVLSASGIAGEWGKLIFIRIYLIWKHRSCQFGSD